MFLHSTGVLITIFPGRAAGGGSAAAKVRGKANGVGMAEEGSWALHECMCRNRLLLVAVILCHEVVRRWQHAAAAVSVVWCRLLARLCEASEA
jgi:hypothetical protein